MDPILHTMTMNRILHTIGAVLGPATTIITALTDAAPPAAKVPLVIAGTVVTLMSNLFAALGRQ